jgi:hypothetical protein
VERQGAEFGDGFWSDHWTYSLDLVETYLRLYPDRQSQLLLDTQISFFQSPNGVVPRQRKYILLRDGAGSLLPRQIGATQPDPEKRSFIDAQSAREPANRNLQRDRSGAVFTASLATKMLMMVVLKFSALDPAGTALERSSFLSLENRNSLARGGCVLAGMGVEMEGGKPGWLDALNGLPALFGSGMPETFETLRMARFLKKTVGGGPRPRPLRVPVEITRLWT